MIDVRSKHIRKALFKNIVISGENISKPLLAALKEALPDTEIEVISHDQCDLTAWVGLSIMASAHHRENPIFDVC